jgi:hypothetical protein
MKRIFLVLAMVTALAVGAAPFVEADRYHDQIVAAAERATGRKVTLGALRFTLLRGLGVVAEDVTISEAPAFGVENLATVGEMEVQLSPWALLTGKVEARLLRMVSPSINLVQDRDGRWNVQAFFEQQRQIQTGSAPTQQAWTAPSIEIRNGRFNFKFVDEKGIFYISEADVDVQSARDDGRLRLNFQFFARPARTDRFEVGFGGITGDGVWRRDADGLGSLQAQVKMERTPVADLITLVQGESRETRGYLSAQATVSGVLNSLQWKAQVTGDDFQRFVISNPLGGPRELQLEGTLRLRDGFLTAKSMPTAPGKPNPISLTAEAQNLLRLPRWNLRMSLDSARLSELAPVARYLGAALPESSSEAAAATGTVSWNNAVGFKGGLTLSGIDWDLGSLGRVKSDTLPLLFEGPEVKLPEVELTSSSVEPITKVASKTKFSAAYQVGEAQQRIVLTCQRTSLAGLRELLQKLDPTTAKNRSNLLSEWFSSGEFSGDWEFSRKAAGGLVGTGDGTLTLSTLNIAGLSSPVQLLSANINASVGSWRFSSLDWKAGSVSGSGSATVRLNSGDGTVQIEETQLKLKTAATDSPSLESLLLPTLKAADWNRFTSKGRSESWLKGRKVSGTLEIGQVLVGAFALSNAQVSWDSTGTSAKLRWQAEAYGGQTLGNVDVDLGAEVPVYKGKFDHRSWKSKPSGTISWQGDFETSGIGPEAVKNSWKSTGTFSGYNWTIAGYPSIKEISGEVIWDGWQQVKVSSIKQLSGTGTTGKGSESRGTATVSGQGEVTWLLSNAPAGTDDNGGIILGTLFPLEWKSSK